MNKLDKSLLNKIKIILSELPINDMSENELNQLLNSTDLLKKLFKELLSNYQEDKVIEKNVIDNISDNSTKLMLNLYLTKNNYTIADFSEEEDLTLLENNEIFKKGSYISNLNMERLYFNDIGTKEILTPEKEKELFLRLNQGDLSVKKEIIECNLKLVVKIAANYYNYSLNSSMDFLDIVSEGNLGLIKAIDKFDVTMGYKFSTYAIWWIRQSITRAITDKDEMIRKPSYLVEKIKKIKFINSYYMNKYGRNPNIDEYVNETDYSEDEINYILKKMHETACSVSLNKMIGDDKEKNEIVEFISDSSKNIENEVEQELLSEEVKEVLETLPLRERIVIILRNGIIKSLSEEEKKAIYLRKIIKTNKLTDKDIESNSQKVKISGNFQEEIPTIFEYNLIFDEQMSLENYKKIQAFYNLKNNKNNINNYFIRRHTLEEIGQLFDITRERIRQIEAKGLRKLRYPKRSRKLKEYSKY